jgi:hypothetical protein
MLKTHGDTCIVVLLCVTYTTVAKTNQANAEQVLTMGSAACPIALRSVV